jgi:hypothetical protein
MNYAIETLEKEKALIEKALNGWETKQYPEAKKQREKRLKQLEDAIDELKNLDIEKFLQKIGAKNIVVNNNRNLVKEGKFILKDDLDFIVLFTIQNYR